MIAHTVRPDGTMADRAVDHDFVRMRGRRERDRFSSHDINLSPEIYPA